MNYKVIMTLNQRQLMDMIDKGYIGGNVAVLPFDDDEVEPAPEAPKPQAKKGIVKKAAPQGRRPSKVNETLLEALQSGERTAKDLRGVLEGAGMSGSSLSTGLAVLQRTGKIERIGDGVYALKQVAAE